MKNGRTVAAKRVTSPDSTRFILLPYATQINAMNAKRGSMLPQADGSGLGFEGVIDSERNTAVWASKGDLVNLLLISLFFFAKIISIVIKL